MVVVSWYSIRHWVFVPKETEIWFQVGAAAFAALAAESAVWWGGGGGGGGAGGLEAAAIAPLPCRALSPAQTLCLTLFKAITTSSALQLQSIFTATYRF